jgi:hypothetical protein
MPKSNNSQPNNSQPNYSQPEDFELGKNFCNNSSSPDSLFADLSLNAKSSSAKLAFILKSALRVLSRDRFIRILQQGRLAFLLLALLSNSLSSIDKAQASSINLQNEKFLLSQSKSADNVFPDKVEAIPDFLKEGQIFDKDLTGQYFLKMQQEMKVVEIPIWIYGTWKGNKQIQDFSYIYGEGISKDIKELNVEVYDSVGDIQTEAGRIYSIVSAGYIDNVVRGLEIIEYQITIKDSRKASLGNFTCSDLSIRLHVDSVTNEILRAFQVQSKKNYLPNIGEDSMLAEGWLKCFDEEGNPISLSHSQAKKELVERHQLLNFDDLEQGLYLEGNLNKNDDYESQGKVQK